MDFRTLLANSENSFWFRFFRSTYWQHLHVLSPEKQNSEHIFFTAVDLLSDLDLYHYRAWEIQTLLMLHLLLDCRPKNQENYFCMWQYEARRVDLSEDKQAETKRSFLLSCSNCSGLPSLGWGCFTSWKTTYCTQMTHWNINLIQMQLQKHREKMLSQRWENHVNTQR